MSNRKLTAILLVGILVGSFTVTGIFYSVGPTTDDIPESSTPNGTSVHNNTSETRHSEASIKNTRCRWGTAERDVVPVQRVQVQYVDSSDNTSSSFGTGTSQHVSIRITTNQQVTIRSMTERTTFASWENAERVGEYSVRTSSESQSNITLRRSVNDLGNVSGVGASDDFVTMYTPRIVVDWDESRCGVLFSTLNDDRIEAINEPEESNQSDRVIITPVAMYYGSVENITVVQDNDMIIRVVRSDEAALDGPSSNAIAHEITLATQYTFDTTQSPDVTALVVPSLGEYDGVALVRDEQNTRTILMTTTSSVGIGGSVHIHEYVHTRQNFGLQERMLWFTEASASYYESVIPARHYNSSDREQVDNELSWEYPNSTLANRSTWESHRVPYKKGARVIAILDTRIQQSTNGQQTFINIMQWMNRQDNPITYDMFRQHIVEVTNNESLGMWMDSVILEPTRVELDESQVSLHVSNDVEPEIMPPPEGALIGSDNISAPGPSGGIKCTKKEWKYSSSILQ